MGVGSHADGSHRMLETCAQGHRGATEVPAAGKVAYCGRNSRFHDKEGKLLVWLAASRQSDAGLTPRYIADDPQRRSGGDCCRKYGLPGEKITTERRKVTALARST